MKKNRKLVAALHDDRGLLVIFSGMILCAMAFVSLLATAGVWYL